MEEVKRIGAEMKQKCLWALFIFLLSSNLMPVSRAHAEDKENVAAPAGDVEALKKEIADVKADRDNVLKQARNFLKEKEELMRKIDAMKGEGSQGAVELEAMKKENEILKGEIEKLKAARQKDQEHFEEDKKKAEQRIADSEAKANSLASTMSDYTPEKIQQLVADRDRLEQENKGMAQRVTEAEKKVAEFQRQLQPLQLDREELQKVTSENRDLQKRLKYISKLEEKETQLLKENTEYREKLEIMKAKFKDAAPGLAKSSRISQKMMRENADMHYNLGTIFLQNKQYEQAIKEYESVLELRPNDPETHYNLGVLYDDYMRDREKALYHYQKYLAINPKAPDAKKVETYILSLELEQKVR